MPFDPNQPFEVVPSPASKEYKGSVLPLSRDANGTVRFDSDAGVLGAVKRAFTLPGEVYQGRVDPLSDEGIGRAAEMATVVSPTSAAARAGEMAIPGAQKALQPPAVKPPTAEALKQAANQGYDRARDMGVDYSAAAVQKLAEELRASLEKDGILAELAPKSFSILNKLANPPEGAVAPLSGLEAARRSFGNAGRDFTNPTEQLAAGRLVDGLDQFVTMADPSSVVAGPAAAAGREVAQARGNYAVAKRSEKIAGAEARAELNAAVANSGQNLDNAIRQRVRDIVTRPKEAAGYSPEELSALERVARGTPVSNTARFMGNLMGGGGGLGAVVSGSVGGVAGAAAGGPVGAGLAAAAVPAAGYGLKKVANALTSRALQAADEDVRRRSPLFQQMTAGQPMEAVSPERRAALVRALLLSGNGQ